jgi:hypothetical protein
LIGCAFRASVELSAIANIAASDDVPFVGLFVPGLRGRTPTRGFGKPIGATVGSPIAQRASI